MSSYILCKFLRTFSAYRAQIFRDNRNFDALSILRDFVLLASSDNDKDMLIRRFPSNFGGKIIFMCSVNCWHQKDSNSLLKGIIGHVTS